MKCLFTISFVFCFLFGFSHVNDLRKPNPPYHNVINPFLQALNIDVYQISLNRDSARVTLYDNTYIDIFIKDKKLWNLSRYDKNNKIIDIGNFKDGTGKIAMQFNGTMYIAKLNNGLLNDSVIFASRSYDKWNYRYVNVFDNGLLQGDSYWYSFIDPNVVSSISNYDKGLITKTEQYGIKSQFIIPLPFFFSIMKQKIRDGDKVCSRTIYEKGKVVSHECFITRKCRRCGY